MEKNNTHRNEPRLNGLKRKKLSSKKKLVCILAACALIIGLIPCLAHAIGAGDGQANLFFAGNNDAACSITYEGNGNDRGDAPVDSHAYNVGESAVVMDKGNLVKYDYAFTGWNTKVDGTGISYQKGNSITFTEPAQKVTLYAQYTKNDGKVARVTTKDKTDDYTDLHLALENGNSSGSTVTLLKDVKLDTEWTPLDFAGTFEGNGCSITGLTINSADQNVGMFKTLTGQVKNLTFYDAKVTSTCANENAQVGVVAGSVGTGPKVSNVTLDSCTVTAETDQVGGITGNSCGAIQNCSVKACSITGREQVGSIVGYFWCGGVTGCTVEGIDNEATTITATQGRVGGLVGKFHAGQGNLGSSRLILGNNSVTANVVANTDTGAAGGLAGQLMGDISWYDIKGNTIDVAFGGETTQTAPIGLLRDNAQAAEFVNNLAANIVANWWDNKTHNSDSYTYSTEATGQTAQIIWRTQPAANGYAVRTDYAGTSFGAKIEEDGKAYYYEVNAFSHMADAVAVAEPGKTITVYGNGNVGAKETKTGEGTEFIEPGTYTVAGNEWANLGYLQLNPSKQLSETRYVLDINNSKLVMTKPQLRASSDLNITDSHVDFANQKDASRGYLFAFRDSTVNVKDSVLGYNATSSNSGDVAPGEESSVTDGNMSAYISGTFNADNSTVYTFTADTTKDAFSLYDRGAATFKDSVLYSGYINIGALESDRLDRQTIGREGEVATLTLDGSKVIRNNSDQYALIVGAEKDGKLVMTNGSSINYSGTDATVNSNGEIHMDANSQIKVNKMTSAGKIYVDMSGASAPVIKLIDAGADSTYAHYEFEAGKAGNYELKAEDGSLYAVAKGISSTVKINDAWAGQYKYGQEVEPNFYFGINAFASANDATQACASVENLKVIACGSAASNLGTLSLANEGTKIKSITLETAGTESAKFSNIVVPKGKSLTITSGAKITVTDKGVENAGTINTCATSVIDASKWDGQEGSIVVDMTNGSDEKVTIVKATTTESPVYNYGNYDFAQGKDFFYELSVDESNSLVAKRIVTPVYIAASNATRQLIDVSGGSSSDQANIQLYEANQTNAQKWNIVTRNNGFSVIYNEGSNKVLDVAGGRAKSGTNVQQYTFNGTDAQMWKVTNNEDGTITFASKLDENLVLDMAGGNTGNGTNIQIYTDNGTSAQKFRFYSLKPQVEPSTASVENGTYTIKSLANQSYYVDLDGGKTASGTNIHLWSGDGYSNDNQIFALTNDGEGYYTIKNCKTDKMAVDVAGACVLPETNVWQYEGNGTDAQKWSISGDKEAGYVFTNKATGLVLDLQGGQAKDGQNIQGYYNNGTVAQKWILTSQLSTAKQLDKLADTHKTVLDNKTYVFNNFQNNNLTIDVAGGSKDDGANVQLYSNNGTDAQKWTVSHDKDGYVTLKNVGSGKVLDVACGSKSVGANVQQYYHNDTDAQKWVVVPVDAQAGKYQLISKLAINLQLGAASSNLGNGTNLCLVSANPNDAKSCFGFTEVSYKISCSIPGGHGLLVATVAGTASTTAKEGEIVALTATPASGYKLDTISVVDAAGNSVSLNDDNSFVMPASNVTATATFVQIPTTTTSLQANK